MKSSPPAYGAKRSDALTAVTASSEVAISVKWWLGFRSVSGYSVLEVAAAAGPAGQNSLKGTVNSLRANVWRIARILRDSAPRVSALMKSIDGPLWTRELSIVVSKVWIADCATLPS